MVSLCSHLARRYRGPGVLRSFITGTILLLALSRGWPSLTADSPATGPFAQWLERQSAIRTWSADLIQTRKLAALTHPLVTTGRVSYAAPGRFRWELGTPPKTIAIRQQQRLSLIYPRLRRVERYDLGDDSTAGHPQLLMLLDGGLPRDAAALNERFRILSQSTSNSLVTVHLEPRAAAARRLMPSLSLCWDETSGNLVETELRFADGSSLQNRFTNTLANIALADHLFEPDLPRDYRIIDAAAQP